MSALDRIRLKFQNNPDAKFGFVVYRCTYSDNAKWDRFMQYLNAQARSALEADDATDLQERLDWNVQEDEAGLERAEPDVVRSRFREWLKQKKEPVILAPRETACVMVDKESLETVMRELNELEEKGMAMGKFDMWGTTWVWLISERWEGSEDGGDELDDEHDGAKRDAVAEEVSSTRVGISYLVPRVYELLDGPGWHNIAREDGEVATP